MSIVTCHMSNKKLFTDHDQDKMIEWERWWLKWQHLEYFCRSEISLTALGVSIDVPLCIPNHLFSQLNLEVYQLQYLCCTLCEYRSWIFGYTHLFSSRITECFCVGENCLHTWGGWKCTFKNMLQLITQNDVYLLELSFSIYHFNASDFSLHKLSPAFVIQNGWNLFKC